MSATSLASLRQQMITRTPAVLQLAVPLFIDYIITRIFSRILPSLLSRGVGILLSGAIILFLTKDSLKKGAILLYANYKIIDIYFNFRSRLSGFDSRSPSSPAKHQPSSTSTASSSSSHTFPKVPATPAEDTPESQYQEQLRELNRKITDLETRVGLAEERAFLILKVNSIVKTSPLRSSEPLEEMFSANTSVKIT